MYIRLLIMDVDGTLTDGKIYMGSEGEYVKAFSIKDGYAICKILPQHGIVPVIITGRRSKIVENRCEELGIVHCYQGIEDKKAVLASIADKFDLNKNENGKYGAVAYIGDDINDLECMKLCGVIGCPCDASEQVKCNADYISKNPGGYGTVREFVEWLILDR